MHKDNLTGQDLLDRHIGLFTDVLPDGKPWRKFTGFAVGPGWLPIVADMLDDMAEADADADPFIESIQNGNGNLEVLHMRSDDRAEAAIDRARDRAGCTCAQCGGQRMEFGEYDWAVGLCRDCLADLRARDARH